LNSGESKLIIGMKKGLPNYNYDNRLDIVLTIQSDAPNKENLLRIRKAAIRINDQFYNNLVKQKAKEIEQLCYSDFGSFKQKIYEPDKDVFIDSLFSNLNFKKFYSFFYNSEQEQKWEIARLISNRYTEFPPARYKTEVPFLQKFKEKIDRRIKVHKGRNVTGFIYSELSKNLQFAIEKLSQMPDES